MPGLPIFDVGEPQHKRRRQLSLSMDIQNRNSALDITRIAALFCVISVHFFLNNGYYNEPMLGGRMYIMTTMRTGFMVCVPLFLMLTGYLMNRKSLSVKYYRGIIKTLGIYLLASAACAVYKIFVLKTKLSLDLTLWGVLGFKTANYSWYIEMYIGLFLLIPFINLIWNNLSSQKAKLALIITFVCLTSLPTMTNIYNFESLEWWKTPYLSTEYRQIIPDWWTRLYPLTYYFLGAYLREFPLKLRQWQKLAIYFGCVIVFGAFNFYRSWGGFFAWVVYNDWHGLPNVIMTFFLFSFLSSINTERYPVWLKRVLMILSDWCLGGYLVSYIFDNLFYAELNSRIPIMTHRLEWYIVIVPAVFVCSLALSGGLNCIYKGIAALCSLVYGRIAKRAVPPTVPAVELSDAAPIDTAAPAPDDASQANSPDEEKKTDDELAKMG